MAYYMYIGKTLFPVAPGKITYKINGRNKTVTLIDEGEVNFVKTPGLTEITIDELLLPNQEYPFASYIKLMDEYGDKLAGGNKYQPASHYLEKLEIWKKRRKPVHFVISRTTPDGKDLLWDTNFDVTIENYEIIEDADKYGMDVAVKLSMKEYRYFGAKKLTIKNSGKKKSTKKNASDKKNSNKKPDKKQVKKKKTRKAKDTPKTYIVKKGDCLMYIARKQLGDGSRWKSIYNLNKSVIEKTAKEHGKSGNGHWIFPGMKLNLPK